MELTCCDVFAASASVGWRQKVVCLYAPDYVPTSTRLSTTQQMWTVLPQALPSSQVTVPIVEGPFTDPEGVGAFFDGLDGFVNRYVDSTKAGR